MCNLPNGYKIERIIEYSFAEVGPWSTDAPTGKSGWYWAIDRDSEVMMVHYEMSPFGGSDFITTVGDDEYLRHYDWQDFTHWLGPLPKPEPPEELTDG